MRTNNIIKLASVLYAFLFCLSCQKDIVTYESVIDEANKESNGVPVVEAIYLLSEYYNEDRQVITEVNPGDEIVLTGINLEGLTFVSYNNMEISVEESYANYSEAVLVLPTDIPEEYTNTLIYANAFGKVDIALKSLKPDLSIIGLDNEFAQPGGEAILLGKSFPFYGFDKGVSTVALVGADGIEYAVEVKEGGVSNDSLILIIPAEAPDNCRMKISVDGEVLTQAPHFRPSAEYAVDVITIAAADKGFAFYVTDPDGEEPINPASGETLVPYCWVNGDVTKGWGTPFTIKLRKNIPSEDLAKYDYVYEIYTAEGVAIPKGQSFRLFVNNKNNEPGWADSQTLDYTTNGRWQTVRVSLEKLVGFNPGVDTQQAILMKRAFVNGFQGAKVAFANFRIEQK